MEMVRHENIAKQNRSAFSHSLMDDGFQLRQSFFRVEKWLVIFNGGSDEAVGQRCVYHYIGNRCTGTGVPGHV